MPGPQLQGLHSLRFAERLQLENRQSRQAALKVWQFEGDGARR